MVRPSTTLALIALAAALAGALVLLFASGGRVSTGVDGGAAGAAEASLLLLAADRAEPDVDLAGSDFLSNGGAPGAPGARFARAGPTTPTQPPKTDPGPEGFTAGAFAARRAVEGAPPLTPPIVVRGRVRGGAVPLASAAIELRAAGFSARGKADERGAFELEWRHGLRADVEVEATGWLVLRRADQALDREGGFEFELEPAATLRFELGTEPTDAGGFELWRQSTSGSRSWIVVPVEPIGDGRFEATPLPAGDYAYQARFGARFAPFREGVRVSAGETRRESVALASGGVVEVRIEDVERRPVPDAQLRLEPDRGSRPTTTLDVDRRDARSDADGKARFEGLAPGPFSLVATSATGAEQRRKFNVGADGGALEIVLRLPLSLVVEGRVRDHQGEPVAKARVEILRADSAPGAPAIESTMSGADGTFALQSVPAGARLVVVAEPPADRADQLGWARVLVGPLGSTPAPSSELVLPAAAPLAGRVVSQAGEPIVGANVVLWIGRDAAATALAECTTSDRGRFSFDRVPEGPAEVEAGAPGFGSARFAFNHSAGAEHSDIALAPVVSLAGRVHDVDGNAVEGVLVRASEFSEHAPRERSDRNGASSVAASDRFGRFEIESLALGRYTIEVVASAWDLTRTIDVALPIHGLLDVEVERDDRPERARIIGHVVDKQTGAAVEGLILMGPRGGSLVRAGTAFEWSGLAPTRTPLAVRAPGRRALNAGPIHLAPGDEHDLGTLVLEPGIEFTVEVLDERGQPLRDAAVRLVPADATKGGPRPLAPPLTLTRQGDRYRTTEAAPGRWRLFVEHPRRAGGSKSVELPTSGTERILLGPERP